MGGKSGDRARRAARQSTMRSRNRCHIPSGETTNRQGPSASEALTLTAAAAGSTAIPLIAITSHPGGATISGKGGGGVGLFTMFHKSFLFYLSFFMFSFHRTHHIFFFLIGAAKRETGRGRTAPAMHRTHRAGGRRGSNARLERTVRVAGSHAAGGGGAALSAVEQRGGRGGVFVSLGGLRAAGAPGGPAD